MPTISETERTALEAGAVWAEAELFSGKPNFKTLMNESYPNLTKEDQRVPITSVVLSSQRAAMKEALATAGNANKAAITQAANPLVQDG